MWDQLFNCGGWLGRDIQVTWPHQFHRCMVGCLRQLASMVWSTVIGQRLLWSTNGILCQNWLHVLIDIPSVLQIEPKGTEEVSSYYDTKYIFLSLNIKSALFKLFWVFTSPTAGLGNTFLDLQRTLSFGFWPRDSFISGKNHCWLLFFLWPPWRPTLSPCPMMRYILQNLFTF